MFLEFRKYFFLYEYDDFNCKNVEDIVLNLEKIEYRVKVFIEKLRYIFFCVKIRLLKDLSFLIESFCVMCEDGIF